MGTVVPTVSGVDVAEREHAPAVLGGDADVARSDWAGIVVGRLVGHDVGHVVDPDPALGGRRTDDSERGRGFALAGTSHRGPPESRESSIGEMPGGRGPVIAIPPRRRAERNGIFPDLPRRRMEPGNWGRRANDAILFVAACVVVGLVWEVVRWIGRVIGWWGSDRWM